VPMSVHHKDERLRLSARHTVQQTQVKRMSIASNWTTGALSDEELPAVVARSPGSLFLPATFFRPSFSRGPSWFDDINGIRTKLGWTPQSDNDAQRIKAADS